MLIFVDLGPPFSLSAFCGSSRISMNDAQFQLHATIEETHWWFVGRRRILGAVIRSLIPSGTGAVIVDVGCGTGANIASLVDGYTCHGIDISERAITFARERFPDVRFSCGFGPADLDLERPADGLLFCDVLEHVESDFDLLATYLPALADGGHIVLTVPADPSLWSPQDEHHSHYLRYTLDRLQEAWRDLPLEPLLVSHFNARLYPIIKLIRVYTNWLGRPWGEADTDLILPSPLANRFLTSLFAGEAPYLLRALDHPTRPPYHKGVSLLAVLQKKRRSARAIPNESAL